MVQSLRFSQSDVPAHLCTSPIPFEAAEDPDETPEGPSITGSGARRKKRRRKRMRSDTHLREEVCSSSEERERAKEWERDSDQTGQESPAAEEPAASSLKNRSVGPATLMIKHLYWYKRSR